MARWGNCDYRQIQALKKKLERLQRGDIDKFIGDCSKELTARLLAKVIKRTPVGQYPSGSGKTGGSLRRGWTALNEGAAQSGGSKNAKAYAESLHVTKVGNTYQIEVVNPMHYASYVEFGHRTSNHNGWVQGRFMMTISEMEIQSQASKILENKLIKYLGECFNAQ